VSAKPKAWFRATLVVGCVVIIDQVAKRVVDSEISPGETRHLLPGLKLVHSFNHGIAFSVPAGGRTLVVIVIAAALVAIVAYFVTHVERPLLWLPTGLMIGGALGNLSDRIRDGAVTDFIKLPLWPAFNLADVAITLGVLTLLYVIQDHVDRGTA
jgi:signal peptidase II